MLRKNTAGQFVHFTGVNATTGAALSGATFTLRVCIDGTFAAKNASTAITEDTGIGFYKIALAAADTNGNDIGYHLTATNAVPVCINVLTTACDPTSTAFGLSLAKTTNITGFNDIAATAIVSAGAITTSGGAVSLVTTTTTVTNQLTAAAIATGVWQDATAGDFTAVNSIGKGLYTTADVVPGAAGGLMIAGSNAATTLASLTVSGTTTLTGAVSLGSTLGVTGVITATNATNDIRGIKIAAAGISNVSFATDVGTTAIATNAIGIAAKKGVVDALNVDTYAEPGQEAPAATNTLVKKIGYLFKAWRNKTTQTATTYSLFNDDAATVDQKATVSDDATTYTKTEVATGP